MTAELADRMAEVTAEIPAAVAVVTLVDDAGERCGMTISSLAPVSGDPPSVLFCIGGSASMRPSFEPGREVCVSVLNSGQSGHSIGFAYGEDRPFEVFDWEAAGNGAPRLVGSTVWMTGTVSRVEDQHGTGVVLVDLTDGEVPGGDPLVHLRQTYVGGLMPIERVAGGAW